VLLHRTETRVAADPHPIIPIKTDIKCNEYNKLDKLYHAHKEIIELPLKDGKRYCQEIIAAFT